MSDLEFLNQISIAKPCPARWDEMTGDERARFCQHCQKHVYNLSAMTAADAVALIREKEGKLCGRIYRRADGTVLTADCPVGLKRFRERVHRVAFAAAAIILGSATALSLHASERSKAAPPDYLYETSAS